MNTKTLTVYTAEEVSKILKLSLRTVKGLLRKGEIKGVKIGGQWRITAADVERLLGQG